MKKFGLGLLVLIFSMSANAFENSAEASPATLDKQTEWGHLKALTFNTSSERKLVIECVNEGGLIGLTDANYVGYNAITPAHRLQKGECAAMLEHIEYGGRIIFEWTLLGCSYGQCRFDTRFLVP